MRVCARACSCCVKEKDQSNLLINDRHNPFEEGLAPLVSERTTQTQREAESDIQREREREREKQRERERETDRQRNRQRQRQRQRGIWREG